MGSAASNTATPSPVTPPVAASRSLTREERASGNPGVRPHTGTIFECWCSLTQPFLSLSSGCDQIPLRVSRKSTAAFPARAPVSLAGISQTRVNGLRETGGCSGPSGWADSRRPAMCHDLRPPHRTPRSLPTAEGTRPRTRNTLGGGPGNTAHLPVGQISHLREGGSQGTRQGWFGKCPAPTPSAGGPVGWGRNQGRDEVGQAPSVATSHFRSGIYDKKD